MTLIEFRRWKIGLNGNRNSQMSTEFPELCKWNAFTIDSPITRCEDCATSKENICHSVANGVKSKVWVVEWQPQGLQRACSPQCSRSCPCAEFLKVWIRHC